MREEIAEKVYIKLHPPRPFSNERQMRLSDLWPEERKKFADAVNITEKFVCLRK